MAADIKFPYEILFRGTSNGEYSGAHRIDFAGGAARGIKSDDLLPIIATINNAAIARVDEQIDELVAIKADHDEAIKLLVNELAAIKAEYLDFRTRGAQAAEAARAVIANPNVSDAQTIATVDQIAAEMLKDKRQRDKDAALRKLAEVQAEVDRFN